MEAIDGWFWKLDLAKVWNVKCELVLEYVREFGTLPQRSTVYKSVKIGIWKNNQRKQKIKGNLSSERIKKLEAVDGWFWKKDVEGPWNVNCQLVLEYVKKFGTLPSYKTVYKGVKIGIWRCNQLQAKKKGNLSSERIKKVETVDGWFWKKKYRPTIPLEQRIRQALSVERSSKSVTKAELKPFLDEHGETYTTNYTIAMLLEKASKYV